MDGDEECRALAARQHGTIALTQALHLGMTARRAKSRIEAGIWVALFRGVYRYAGAPRTWHQAAFGVSLWIGARGALSHAAAAAVWGLDRFDGSPLCVAVRGGVAPPRGTNLEVHCHWSLQSSDVVLRQGIRVTSVPRTLIDLAAVLSPHRLEHVLDDALVQRLTTAPAIAERLERMNARGRGGIGVLRRLVEARLEGYAGDSALEARFLRLLRRAGLPNPEAQVTLRAPDGAPIIRADFAYPSHRIAIQLESFRWHAGRQRFDKDLRIRNRLLGLGWQVLHVTDDALRRRPDELVAQLRALFLDDRSRDPAVRSFSV